MENYRQHDFCNRYANFPKPVSENREYGVCLGSVCLYLETREAIKRHNMTTIVTG